MLRRKMKQKKEMKRWRDAILDSMVMEGRPGRHQGATTEGILCPAEEQQVLGAQR